MTYAVVTRVPQYDQETGVMPAGNLAAAIGVYTQTAEPDASNGYLGRFELDPQMALTLMLTCRMEVFTLGEILVLGEDGREISGRGRKPSKWDVTIESFNTIEAAVQCALRVDETESEGDQVGSNADAQG